MGGAERTLFPDLSKELPKLMMFERLDVSHCVSASSFPRMVVSSSSSTWPASCSHPSTSLFGSVSRLVVTKAIYLGVC